MIIYIYHKGVELFEFGPLKRELNELEQITEVEFDHKPTLEEIEAIIKGE